MGLLKSVDNVPGIDYYEYRDNQYYNKYEYRLRAKVPCVRYTWWCKKPEDLDKKIEGKSKTYGSIRKEHREEVVDNAHALKTIINLQKDKKNKQIGIRVEGDTFTVFANDLSVLKSIGTELGSNYPCDYTQVQTAHYAGVKYFVNEPNHKYRVYLKTKRVEDNFHTEFREMCERLTSLHPSNALKRWMNRDGKRYGTWYFRWTSSAHFIDYDDESTLSYLALMHGDILGKKYKLEKRPDNI